MTIESIRRGNVIEKNPFEQLFVNLGIMTKGERVTTCELLLNTHGAESFVLGYKFVFASGSDRRIQHIKETCVVSPFTSLDRLARDMLARADKLAEIGVPIPKIFGFKDGSIYSEFIPVDNKDNVIESIRRLGLTGVTHHALIQLVEIARKLDSVGFHPLDFIGDLIYDPEREIFLYVDFGSDLGHCDGTVGTNCLSTLIQRFPALSEHIKKTYTRFQKVV